MTAYEEGWQALVMNKSEGQYPYSDLPRRNAWLQGWPDAKKQIDNT
ncbi:hypothetical protein FEE96_06135 [Parasedimentitalea maritima]|uniref:Ribosome modulation factor n=1 Tax=Parasedimentitalea maritima TaxID=2578117 RepID=A0ABY2V0U7_9RHOB|nr:hypothetical protein FEE96_06135 [Zongyanglinia marina]